MEVNAAKSPDGLGLASLLRGAASICSGVMAWTESIHDARILNIDLENFIVTYSALERASCEGLCK